MGALNILPTYAEAVACWRAGKYADAEGMLRQILAADPNNTECNHVLAAVLTAQGKMEEARRYFLWTLQHRTGAADTFTNYASFLVRMKEYAEIDGLCLRALAIDPRWPAAYFNMGRAALARMEYEEAVRAFEKALELKAKFADGWWYLGMALYEGGKWAQGLAALEKAIALEPGHVGALTNRAYVLLVTGDLERGFPAYAARWDMADAARRRHEGIAQWKGEDVRGKRILVWCEQGLGDAIQFLRYGKWLKERGAVVVVECRAEIAPLARRWSFVDEVHVRDAGEMPRAEFKISQMDLPMAFGTTLATIPAEVPYVAADTERVAAWGEKLKAYAELKVGLVWAGGAIHKENALRSLTLAQMGVLRDVQDVTFFGLQVGAPAAQGGTPPQGMAFVDLSAELTDFLATAAVIANLDLVITVDTAMAHLAGAMGKPVWTMVQALPDWRWMLERSDTPWYPTMRLFRQTQRDDWTGVLRNVKVALTEWVKHMKAEGGGNA